MAKRILALTIFCILIAIAFGCRGPAIYIRQDIYSPGFDSSNLSRYEGKSVYLSLVENVAPNTSIWGYYSGKTAYEAYPSLRTYFWDCFIKSFRRIGVNLVSDSSAPELRVIFTSVTDQKVDFNVTFSRMGKAPFQKNFTVTMEPASHTDNALNLENRAYRLVDELFMTFMTDSEFQKVFFEP